MPDVPLIGGGDSLRGPSVELESLIDKKRILGLVDKYSFGFKHVVLINVGGMVRVLPTGNMTPDGKIEGANYPLVVIWLGLRNNLVGCTEYQKYNWYSVEDTYPPNWNELEQAIIKGMEYLRTQKARLFNGTGKAPGRE